jgi:hypothetical protein
MTPSHAPQPVRVGVKRWHGQTAMRPSVRKQASSRPRSACHAARRPVAGTACGARRTATAAFKPATRASTAVHNRQQSSIDARDAALPCASPPHRRLRGRFRSNTHVSHGRRSIERRKNLMCPRVAVRSDEGHLGIDRRGKGVTAGTGSVTISAPFAACRMSVRGHAARIAQLQ